MQPTEPSFPGTGAPGGTEVAVSQAVAESPDQPSASQVITQTMAPAEELLDIDKAGSLAPDIGSDLPEEDAYHSTVVGPLTALVSDELPSQELTEETTQEICRLLIKRLPESACGQEDAIAPIRANLWSVMLLGLRPDDLNSQHNLVSSSLHGLTAEAEHALGMMHFPKEDQRVLAADIKRTRQAYAMFKREEVMQIVSQVLERYCVGHGIRYKQGQNELIAPFVVLQDPPLPLPVLGLLFESFMSRFVSRWFVDDEIEALLVSYRVFRVLLFYVDPGLAGKLDEADFVPELYATAWLITLFSRNLSLDLVLRLWDVYLAVNDPALVFFLLAALLVRNRDTIISVNQAHMMPETVQGLNITDKQDLEELIVQAREMLRKFPASFLQTVRSCCSDHGNTPLDTSRSLFCEAVRCASIRPGELLERMSGRSGQAAMDADEEDDEGGEEGRDRSPCPMRPGPVDTVALDIRPLNEYESSGVGHLGKSLRLDPYLLYMDDVLEKWMQHFDGTRGTHVCLVDSLDPPPSPSPSPVAATTAGSAAAAHSDKNNANAWRGGKNPSPRHHEGGGNTDTSRKENPSIIEDPLWRRLLFGDGDAATGAAGEDDWVKLHEDGGGGSRGNGDNRREAEVGVGTGGNAATQEGTSGEEVGEGFGAARAFAEKLHARGFPYVSILEGGMEGIVDHLRKAGSPLEPTVINHDPEAYQLWREAQAHRRAAHPPAEQRAAASRAGEAFSWRGKKHNDNSAAARETDWQHQQHQQQQMQQVPREANASEGGRQSQSDASQRRPEEHGHPKIGVMDRLGLARVRDGVTHSVGTVARTGAWAVRGGAGVVMPSIRSTDGGLQAGGEEGGTGEGPKHARTESGNIWEAEAAPPGARGGGLVDEDGRDVSAIFGAIRNAQVGVLGGVTRGVGTMRRTGAWAARGGAEIIHSASRPSSAEYSSGEGAGDLPQLPRLSPRSGCSGSGSGSGGGGGGGGGGGSGGGGSDGSSVRAGGSGEIGGSDSAAMGLMEPPFSVDEENDKEMLVVALKTAEENGHVAAAKALRARLGFIQGQALRTQLSRDGSGGGGGSGDVATVGSADAIVGIEKEVMMTFAELYD